jgi:hypothetical protein
MLLQRKLFRISRTRQALSQAWHVRIVEAYESSFRMKAVALQALTPPQIRVLWLPANSESGRRRKEKA